MKYVKFGCHTQESCLDAVQIKPSRRSPLYIASLQIQLQLETPKPRPPQAKLTLTSLQIQSQKHQLRQHNLVLALASRSCKRLATFTNFLKTNKSI